jgi:hypothetical protein
MVSAMITLNTEAALFPYREAYRQMAIGATAIRGALAAEVTAEIRGRLAKCNFVPFRLAHRGHYAFLDDVQEPALVRGAVKLAEFVTGLRLAVAVVRCLRLRAGDYVLSSDDPTGPYRPSEGNPAARCIELTADLSESSSGEAQVVYSHRGKDFFVMPQLSGCIALVERRSTVTRYDRFLNHRVGEAVVYRLRLTLVRPAVPPTDPPPRGLVG